MQLKVKRFVECKRIDFFFIFQNLLLSQEANSTFRILLNESTRRLKLLSKKLGSCIEKARPYHEAQEKARLAQIECQAAAVKFQRANGKYYCFVCCCLVFMNFFFKIFYFWHEFKKLWVPVVIRFHRFIFSQNSVQIKHTFHNVAKPIKFYIIDLMLK